MLSTLNLKSADSNDQEVVGIVPAVEEASGPARDATLSSLDASLRPAPDFSAERPVPPVEATFRPAAADTLRPAFADTLQIDGQAAIQIPDQGSWLGSLMKRAATGLLVMLAGAASTLAWQRHGDEAKQIVATWALHVAMPSWLPLKEWLPLKDHEVAEPSNQPLVGTAEATVQAPQPDAPQPAAREPVSQAPVAQQPAPSAQASPETAAPAASVPPAELALQAMARDLATVQQGIEQIKANQEQLARDLAKLAEQDARRKPPVPSPRPISTSARKPALPSPQAAVQPHPASPSPAVAQTPVQPQISSAPRPPAPLP